MSEVTAATVTAPVEATSTEAKAPETNSTPTPAEVKKYKLKAAGEESEHTEEEIIRLASLGKGANKKFEEAAGIRKQAEQFMKQLKEDPMSILTNPKLGIDFKSIAEDYLYKSIQEDMLSPDQKKQRDLEAELEKYRSKDKEELTKKQEAEQARAEAHYTEHYDKMISSGLADSGLPKTASTIRSVAKYLNMALEAGYDVDVKDIIPLVKQDYLNQIKELFGASDGDTLLALLGDNTDKIRKADLARLRGSQQPIPKPQSTPVQAVNTNKPMDKYEASEFIKRKLGLT